MRRAAAGSLLALTLAPAVHAQTGAAAPAPPAGAVQPAPLAASEQRAGHLRLGLRTGYGVPLGRYAEVRNFAGFVDDDVNRIGDDTYGVIPLWLDAGYWLTSHVYLGAYFAFGLVLPKQAASSDPLGGGCPQDFDCSATGVRAGIQAEYAFGPYGRARPWLGLGFGYEWVSTKIDGRTLDLQLESLHHGPELLQLSGGTDFGLSRSFELGPFASLSAVRYTSCSLDFGGQQACEIEAASWHGWLVLGVRGTLTP